MLANRSGLAVGALVVALVSCGNDTGATPRDTDSPHTLPPSTGEPAELVGSWFVAADGEEPDAILTIGNRVDGGLLLYRQCGTLFGGWRANGHAMFVGDFDGGSGDCFEGQQSPFPAWMTKVTGYRRAGEAELLTGATGATVATLTPGAHPSPQPDSVAEYASPPVVTDKMRKDFAEPAPLPDGVRPVTVQDLVGRWLPLPGDLPEGARSKAFVAFEEDGTYTGSDGCNGVGGRYALGTDGIILATSGTSTLVGCENLPLPGWPAQSGRLGLRDGHLVFVDPAGKILGEAVRG